MNASGIVQQIKKYGSLVRFSHTVFALPFALAAVVLSVPYAHFTWLRVAWILLCIVTARTAAMAFNRLIDRHIDAKNPRTQVRELPQGVMSIGEVRLLVVASCAVFVFGAAMLGTLPLLLSPVALVLALGYSYTKRFTAWCHVVLGAAVAFAPGGAWVAMNAPLDVAAPYLLVLAVATWVAGFDVFYSLQDQAFDQREGLYSVPVKLGTRGALMLSAVLHVVTVSCLVAVGFSLGLGTVYYVGVAMIAGVLFYEHRLVKPDDLSKINTAFFTLNGIVSFAYLAAVWADFIS